MTRSFIHKVLQFFIGVLIQTLTITGVFGQSTGSITGKIVDSNSEALPGANVIVKGTYYGAATDLEGRFQISGMSAGVYDIQFSMMGYKVVLKTGVQVVPGVVENLDIILEETTLALGQEIVVEGERPLLDVEQTSSSVRITSDDLQNKMVNSVDEILSDQAGVSTVNNEIHIRGGRVDESMFIVDGMSVKDPLSGYSNNLYVNVDAIEELEVVTGGFNAEYGQAMSGIVNIKLKEGSQDYHGSFTYSSDNFALSNVPWESYDNDHLEFTLSGPEPISSALGFIGLKLPGEFSFFANGYVKLSNTYLPTADSLAPTQDWMKMLALREENDWHALYKLTWRIDPMKKFSISYDRSLNLNQGYFMSRFNASNYYPYEYQPILNNYNTLTKESILTTGIWSHTLSPKLFYEVTFGRFFTNLHSAAQNKYWYDYQEYVDLQPINYLVSPTDGRISVTFGDGFNDHGNPPEWYDYYSENYSVRTDVNYQPSYRHSFKGGFTHQQSQIQVIDINSPWLGESGLGQNYDFFNATADNGAFYIQDKITFDGMIANLGVRYDYWFPGQYLEAAVGDTNVVTITDAAREKFYQETFRLFGDLHDRYFGDSKFTPWWLGLRGKGHFSPRIGISHPVTDADVLYFNYGHFSQLPTYNYVYAKLRANAEATYQLFGNPNLNPKTTVAYEIGLKHKFDDNQVIEIKAFYKDMFDYETSQRVTKFNPRLGNISYLIYINMDFARSRGIEINFKRRFAQYFSADANFSYSLTTGKSSTPLDNLLVEAGRLDEKPLGENYLSWDQPIRFFMDLNYNVDPEDDLRLFGIRMPRNWGINTRIEYESGKRYTPLIITGWREENGELQYIASRDNMHPYSKLAPSLMTVDLKFNKYFTMNGLDCRFFWTVNNLFNIRQPRSINPLTGKGYTADDIEQVPSGARPVADPRLDPSAYSWPRSMDIGVTVRW